MYGPLQETSYLKVSPMKTLQQKSANIVPFSSIKLALLWASSQIYDTHYETLGINKKYKHVQLNYVLDKNRCK